MQRKPVSAGFLPLYLKLYEELTPGYYENYSGFIDDIKAAIEKAGIRIVSPGVVFDTPHIRNAEKLFAKEKVSFIILLHLSYSPSLLIADFLEQQDLPILSIDTTPAFSFENMNSEYLTQNHGIHGVMDLTSVLKSRGVDYTVVSGYRTDRGFQKKLNRNLKAFYAASLYKNQNIGITGKPFIGMGDFSIDFQALENQFGISVQDIPLEMIQEQSSRISDSAIMECIEEDKKNWDVSRIKPETHQDSIRIYLGLKTIMEEKSLSGYTMNFQYISEDISTPFYACSRIMSEGWGYGGEGDVLTATLGYPMNTLSAAAKFDEFFCADWKNNRILMSHMGESDSRFVKPGSSPYLSSRDGFVNPRESVIYRFQGEPGEVTFINLCPVKEGGYRMVAGLIEIVDAPILDEIISPHYQVQTRIPVGEFLENYAEAGGGHHLYIAKGNILEELGVFTKLLGFHFTSI